MSEQNETLQTGRSAVGGISDTLREQLHRHEAVCEELEQLPARTVEDYPAEIARITAEFKALPPLPPEYAEILEKRFAAATKEAERAAAENAERLAQRAAKLEECARLSAELDSLIAGAELVTPGEVEKLEKRWNECLKSVDPEAAGAADFAARFEPLKARILAEAEADRIRGEQAEKLAAELAELTAGEDMAHLQERKTAIEAEYAALGSVPKAAADKYNAAHRAAGTKLAQHYETLDLARWESYTLKLDLCAELDRLLALPDAELPKAARTLHELRDKWKGLGGVPKSKSEEINARYLETTRKLQHRVDEYYAHLRQEQRQAAAAKQALVERAAALADSTEWNATAEAFKALQAEWKQLPGAGNAEKNLYAAFRAPADKFFSARSAYFDERNRKFDAAAEAKRALIAEAQALRDQPGDVAARRARQLRSDYHAAGPAGRAEHELLAQFNAALDQFFSGRREAFAEREKRARELIAEIETLSAGPTDPAAADKRVREIRTELRELACRNTFDAEKKALAKFEAALGSARSRQLSDRLSLVKSVARPLAEVWQALKSGETVDPEKLEIDHLDRFHRLHTAAELIRAAAGGDAKALKKLSRLEAAAQEEHDRINAALEKLAGITPAGEAAAPLSLAAELEAAIAGNFAKSSAAAEAKPADPGQLLNEYLNAGLLAPEPLEESFRRFDAAYAKLHP